MAELSLILTLDLAALATAGWASRWLSRLSPGDKEDQRLTRALRSAADGIARKQLVQLLWSVSVLIGLCAILSWVFSRPALLWFGSGAAAGGLVCWTLGQLAQSFSMTAAALAARVLATADSAVVIATRSASAALSVSQVAALLCGAGLLLFTMQGGLTEHRLAGMAFVGGAVVGGLFVALFSLLSGAALRIAGVVSRRSTSQAAKQPFHWVETRNPSLILDLVSTHGGVATSRAQMLFCTGILFQLVAISLPAETLIASTDSQGPLAALLCAQAAAVVCHASIMLTLRADDSARSWVALLWRGQLAAVALSLCAVAGTALWLVPATSRGTTLWCGSLGVVLSLLSSLLSARHLSGRSRRLEERPERTRGSILELFMALQASLHHAPLFLATIVLGLAVPWGLSESFPLSLHHLFWLTLGLMTALPYLGTQAFLEPVLEASNSLASLRSEGGRAEPQGQLAALNTVASHASANAHRFICVSTALLACLVLGTLAANSASAPTTIASSELWAAALAALGAISLVAMALGLFIRQAQHASHTGLNEVQRQLRTHVEPRPDGEGTAKPGYAAYLEQTASRAVSRAALQCAAIMFLFIWLWFLCARFTSQVEHPVWLRHLSFLAFTAAPGISVSLVGGGIASYLGLTRGFRRQAVGSPDGSAIATSGVTELAGTALAPAALLLVKVAAALSLTLPFLFT